MRDALSHGLLLSSSGPTQVGVPHTTGNIKEVGRVLLSAAIKRSLFVYPSQLLLLGYRMEHVFTGLPTQLVCGVRMIRVVAHCLQLLMLLTTEAKHRWVWQ